MSMRAPRLALSFLVLTAAASLLCAAPDLAPPKAREKVVADAVRIAAERNTPAPLPAVLPNPFLGKEEVQAEEAAHQSSAPESALTGRDLLASLAARIPSTGTMIMGGEPILLLGQKRLKVGDSFAISFEGQTYELSIAAVNATSFTVKRGENVHTRPVRISAASTNTPTTRP